MEISGLVKTSLIDFPGKIAAVVFTQGCNFQCGFCHNPDLIPMKKGNISEDKVFEYLNTRKGKLDGVVITGGEPIIHEGLEDFIKSIRKLGFAIKLDTNGSNPVKLQSLLDKNLIDYVAMDIKGSLGAYPKISKYLNKNVIQESIKIIISSGVEYEFRTTVLPYYHKLSDFQTIGKLLDGAKTYTIQGFRSQITLDKKLKTEASFSMNELEEIRKIMAAHISKVIVHENLS
jgi:pyruvate formate lyase activating enzyme